MVEVTTHHGVIDHHREGQAHMMQGRHGVTSVVRRGVTRNMVYYYINNGTIKPEVVDGRYYLSDNDVEFLVAKYEMAKRSRELASPR